MADRIFQRGFTFHFFILKPVPSSLAPQDKSSQFMKYPHGQADYLGYGYDYNSVMHYPRHAFGKKDANGRKMRTIIPKNRPWQRIGQRTKFSDIDLAQIKALYNCPTPTTPPTATQSPSRKKRKRKRKNKKKNKKKKKKKKKKGQRRPFDWNFTGK